MAPPAWKKQADGLGEVSVSASGGAVADALWVASFGSCTNCFSHAGMLRASVAFVAQEGGSAVSCNN